MRRKLALAAWEC